MKVKGTPHVGEIKAIVTDERMVVWDRLFPSYIHIEIEGGVNRMAHHSQLKRVVKV